jgi:hypothetical protein
MKRYKWKRPESIKPQDAWVYEIIRKDTFTTTGEDWQGRNDEGSACFSDIPKDWLEEIKDEPVSAEDWVKSTDECSPCLGENVDCKDCSFTFKNMTEAFKAGEANNELRHRPQRSFEEWIGGVLPSWDMEDHKPAWDSGAMRNCWKAAQKAVGVE